LREIHFQYSLNPLRCQPITVSGCTMKSACFHPDHKRLATAQKTRSDAARRGRECLCVNAARTRESSRQRRQKLQPACHGSVFTSKSTSLYGRFNRLIQRQFGALARHSRENRHCTTETCDTVSLIDHGRITANPEAIPFLVREGLAATLPVGLPRCKFSGSISISRFKALRRWQPAAKLRSPVAIRHESSDGTSGRIS